MIEKIFIVFVIMEGFAVLLHIADSIRCWGDRIYYRKQQERVQHRDDEMCELNKENAKRLATFNTQVNYLCDFSSKLDVRLKQVENKLSKSKTKKVKTVEEEKDFRSAREAEEIGG